MSNDVNIAVGTYLLHTPVVVDVRASHIWRVYAPDSTPQVTVWLHKTMTASACFDNGDCCKDYTWYKECDDTHPNRFAFSVSFPLSWFH